MSLFGKVNNKYNEVSKKKYFYLLASIPWVLFIIFLAVTMYKHGYIAYESNDDAFLNLIPSGAFGHKYSLNIYNNVIIGWVLTVLYGISETHNWYTIMEVGLFFSAVMVMGVCNICRNKLVKGYLTNIIILWASVFSMMCKMNYSKTAAFVLAVGLFILCAAVDNADFAKLKNRLMQILAVIFILAGGLLRKQSLYAVIPFAGLLVIYLILKYKKGAVKRLIPWGIAGVLLMSAWIGDACAYNSDPDWKHFVEYNELRTSLIDYGIPHYDDCREAYDAIGLSAVDVSMLSNWYYADEEVFSIDTLKKVIEIRDNNKEKKKLSEKIEELATGFVKTAGEYRIIYILLFLFLVLCIRTNKKIFGYQLLSMLIGAGEVLGLLLINRIPERSVYIAVLSAMIVMVYFVNEEKYSFNKTVESICLCLVGIFALYGLEYTTISKRFENVVYDKTYSDQFFSYVNSHSGNLYVYSVQYEEYFLRYCYSPLENPNLCRRTNAVIEGGWLVPSPIYTNLIEPYGDKYNLFRAMAENDNVYWIADGNIESYGFVEYMKQHYGVSPIVVDNIAGIYEVISFTAE